MSLERKSGGGGLSGSALPITYEYKVNPTTAKLQLWKKATATAAAMMISEQSEEGLWAATSIATGTGSVHVGDLHSMGSGGENVTWVNTDSGYAWFPAWQAVKTDGSAALALTTRIHGTSLLNVESAGTLGTATVDYNDTYTATGDVAFFKIDTTPAETYTGRLKYRVTKIGGKEVAAFYFNATATSGVGMTIPFKYPLWVLNGQVFTTTLTKDDGTFFRVKASASQVSRPYRKSYYRTFIDSPIVGADIGDTKQAYRTVDHNGWIMLDGRAKSSLTSGQQTAATSIGFGVNLPDTRDKLLMAGGSTYANNTTGGSYTIAQNKLPNVTLAGSASYTPAGTCSSTTGFPIAGYNGGLVQTPIYTGTGSLLGYAGLGTAHFYTTSVSTSFTGNAAVITTSNISLNGGVTQQAFVPAFAAINHFVYLGA